MAAFKLAVAGKGGAGKTFVAGTLARLLAAKKREVVAVDADPAMNLAYALGVTARDAETIIPISENLDLIQEKTGATPGGTGYVFNLAPKVNDIVDRYGAQAPDGIRLLVLGTVRTAGSGCMCPANALLRALLRHHLLGKNEDVVVDTEAGLEHLGRGVVRGFNLLLDVVEPRSQSVQTGLRIAALAQELQVTGILFVANKVKDEDERSFLLKALAARGHSLFAVIPYDQEVERADMLRIAPIDHVPSSAAVKAVRALAEALSLPEKIRLQSSDLDVEAEPRPAGKT